MRRMVRRRLLGSAAPLALSLFVAPLPAPAADVLPTDGTVVAGSAAISRSGGALTVTQSSDRAVVNWSGFSIGAGNSVTFVQPGRGSAILNRVTGEAPSTLAGQLSANGQVFLVNPNGIAITRSGRVSVGGGFVGSTLAIADAAFLNGRLAFTGTGHSAGVANAGTITTGDGGFIGLLGGTVAHAGTITAPLGRVALGAGEQAVLDLGQDGLLQVAVPSGASAADGTPLVDVSGKVAAAGGRVEIRAATAASAVRHAVNLSGVVEASSARADGGAIVLDGGDGGTVTLSGSLDASSAAGRGGHVAVTGRDLQLAGARLDASGARGGGTVAVGGGRQGSGPLPHAQSASIDAGTTIRADGGRTGSGGEVVVWSDGATQFRGTISAQGGSEAGDGGAAEVSSKGLLDYAGSVDLTAAAGQTGTLLLDPYNVTISNDSMANLTASSGTYTAFTASGNDSVLNATTLVAALGTANVSVSTGNASSPGSQAGVITVGSDVLWTSGKSLTLAAAGGIIVKPGVTIGAGATQTLKAASNGLVLKATSKNAAITIDGTLRVGSLTVTAGSVSGAGTIKATGDVAVAGTFTLTLGAWAQNAATLPAFSVGDFRLSGGSFLRVSGGDGSTGNPYQVSDVYGLQGIGSSNLLGKSWALAGDIDASGTANWNVASDGTAAGFAPIGGTSSFKGSFDGRGHTIRGLTINSYASAVGLFSALGGSGSDSIKDLVIDGAQVTAHGSGLAVGILVGSQPGLDPVPAIDAVAITNSTLKVDGAANSGGNISQVGLLVGSSLYPITRSSASGTITISGDAIYAGGLVGRSQKTIDRSAASVTITVTDRSASTSSSIIGGLVGKAEAAISNSYATGSVAHMGGPGSSVGGLVGSNASSVDGSYATTSVSGVIGDAIGALVGSQSGAVTGSYWLDRGTTGWRGGVSSQLDLIADATGLSSSDFTNTATFATKFPALAGRGAFGPPTGGAGTIGDGPQLFALTPIVWYDGAKATRPYGATSVDTATATLVGGGPNTYRFGSRSDTVGDAGASSWTPTVDANAPVGIVAVAQSDAVTSTQRTSYTVVKTGVITVTGSTILTIATGTQLRSDLESGDVTITGQVNGTLSCDVSTCASYGGLTYTADLGKSAVIVQAPLTWKSANILSIQSVDRIVLDGQISASTGTIKLAPTTSVTAAAQVSAGLFELDSGAWVQNGASLPTFSANDFRLAGGSFLRVSGGNGSATPYQVTDVYGLQGIGSSAEYLSKSWVLANDIDASGTAGWNAVRSRRELCWNLLARLRAA